ncbi:CehA/McbA family metallohydrolase [Halegenticoccus soli]|uniref:CehA/McbA family metallohydrolase n=1 Tax=Halegenticoccus soli TaxID=1985678 RepID=UPI000C6DB0E1|nr:PHP domain-containing protein [Halegenticoccus soli]
MSDAREPNAGGERRLSAPSRRSQVVVRIDAHVHSEASYDAETPVERVLERARDVGLDGVVVTDHDAVGESLRAAALAPEYGLIGIPGVEVSTADGHLLAVGVERAPEPGRPLAETAATVRSLGGVAVVPHPFQRIRHGVRRRTLAGSGDGGREADGGEKAHEGQGDGAGGAPVDGIEIYNAHTLTGVRNAQAAAFARAHGLPGFGGSDAHRADLVGRAYTEVTVVAAGPIDADAVVEAMRAGRTRAHGRRITVRGYVRKYARNVRLKTTSML